MRGAREDLGLQEFTQEDAGGLHLGQHNSSIVPRKLRRKLRIISSRSIDKVRKLDWRLRNGRSNETTPIYIIGAQRSGTTMLGECLGRSPQIENLGESDPRAFHRYSLLDDSTVRDLIQSCPSPHIVFKPLKDSYRIINLLNMNSGSKAVWAYRNFADRINSAVNEFGRHPLDVFEQFKESDYRSWQLISLSREDEQLIRSLDYSELELADGAALMWYIRNALYFNLNLSQDPRICLLSYDAFVVDPQSHLRKITDFIGTQYYPYMSAGVHSKSIRKNPQPKINERIATLCNDMYARLEDQAAQSHRKLTQNT